MKVFSAGLGLVAAVVFADDNHEDKRLIALSDTNREWLTLDQIAALEAKSIGFVDATNGVWDELPLLVAQHRSIVNKTYPEAPQQQALLESIHDNVDPDDLKALLTEFVEKFPTRYRDSPEGKQSAGWIYDHVHELRANARDHLTLTVRKFEHTWGQYSVIARVEPAGGATYDDVVVLSAHQDSINRKNLSNAPGADDDGSGTVTIFQTLKLLLDEEAWAPVRPVEFHWYAAEETGLQGSAAIVKAYATQHVDVYAQVQQDMTGYVAPGSTPVVAFASDFSSPSLVTFLQRLVETYLDIGWVSRDFGYGASDHASWFRAGYPSSFPFEAARGFGNPYIHSANDTLDKIDWKHVADFTKFSIAYVVELTQEAPNGDDDDTIKA
ncbi:Aste57867_7902 [Aphanomyces stellatus]|uniref:Aste57867_7902 protein n=1 Tax=Aphanomyces stellatus TaxID=120398 RepID=A0A485KIZ0_9STRA|nr:hypothetical protein As57867_007872 [Aphanomyces stellatus]VFT84795.1 Aste57867_7902 [Aphanomyces stellatus]